MAWTVHERSARLGALGDPVRLAIFDALAGSDRSPVELRRLIDVPSNLLAHHLDVLERVGLISRRASSGDGRRRYVHLEGAGLDGLLPSKWALPLPVVFVCTHNSARSQLAAALWTRVAETPAQSAGTQPAAQVHPGAVAAAARVGIDISGSVPRSLDDVGLAGRLVITVCDVAHEELTPDESWLHWSIADPSVRPTRSAFDATVVELRHRIGVIVGGAA